jgi:uncharacterized membrane protein
MSAIGFFRNANVYDHSNASQLAIFSIIIGVLYMKVVIIEIIAFFASPVKIPLVRAYAYLSGLVVLIIAAIGLIQTVVHFIFKNEMIDACDRLAGDNTVFYGGLFGPQSGGDVDAPNVESWCNSAWKRGSWSNIVAFLITTFLAAVFSAVAFGYLRQVLDPMHSANVFREPAQHRLRMGNMNLPTHYNPSYSPTYANDPSYHAPAGPPPKQGTDAFVPPYDVDSKPPGYVRDDDYRGGFGEKQKGDESDDGSS